MHHPRPLQKELLMESTGSELYVWLYIGVALLIASGLYIVALMYNIPALRKGRVRRFFAYAAILSAGAFLGFTLGVVLIGLFASTFGIWLSIPITLVASIGLVGLVSVAVLAIKDPTSLTPRK